MNTIHNCEHTLIIEWVEVTTGLEQDKESPFE